MASPRGNRYAVPIDELERSVRVPAEQQGTLQPAPPPEPVLSEHELDVQRLLGVTGAGRLRRP